LRTEGGGDRTMRSSAGSTSSSTAFCDTLRHQSAAVRVAHGNRQHGNRQHALSVAVWHPTRPQEQKRKGGKREEGGGRRDEGGANCRGYVCELKRGGGRGEDLWSWRHMPTARPVPRSLPGCSSQGQTFEAREQVNKRASEQTSKRASERPGQPLSKDNGAVSLRQPAALMRL
jgi:hypothetical protein